MMRMNDVLLLFKISRATVYKWMRNGLPHYYVGKLLFFKKDQVDEWVQNNGKSLK